jgi:formyltetrahydrofolate hydrolase
VWLDQHSTEQSGGTFVQRTNFHLPRLTAARDALEPDFGDRVRLGADVERAVLSRAVLWHCEDRIIRYGNQTIVF